MRTYDRAKSVVFRRTSEEFGGLSNMAAGFPLTVNGIRILTSEALYQACRFPHMPEVQRLIIAQASPMTAKMKSKPYRHASRSDWDQVRVKIMRWCLRAKLAQSWVKFSELLLATGERPIVEESRKDHFWGAEPVDEQTLIGRNVLGRLLMELREEVKQSQDPKQLLRVEPLLIPDFLLDSRPILPIISHGEEGTLRTLERTVAASEPKIGAVQAALFAQPSSPIPEEDAVARGILEAVDTDNYQAEKQSAKMAIQPDEDAANRPEPLTMTLQRISVALRGTLYASGFVLLWVWLAVSLQPLDKRLPVTISPSLRAPGIVVGLAGVVLAAWCIITFITRGRGTPAPFDPPRDFVASGAYRYARNPMYIGGAAALLGAGLMLASPTIVILAAFFWLAMHLLVVFYEEPVLENRFGESYVRYKASVNRWLPRPP
jgi:ribA/ribD-fused uncharacterized protein